MIRADSQLKRLIRCPRHEFVVWCVDAELSSQMFFDAVETIAVH